MHPTLIEFGPFSLSSYGFALACACIVAAIGASDAARKSVSNLFPLSGSQVIDWASWAMVGGVLGGRIIYVLFRLDEYASQPLEIFAIWHGGLVWYGGFAGGVIATLVFLRRNKVGFLTGLDQVIPFVALGHAIGRIGCFANGCCAGKQTEGWFGVHMPGLEFSVVPIQLVEAACLVILYCILRSFQNEYMKKRPGAVFGMYMLGYGLIRWFTEYWRANQPAVYMGFTLQQVLSLALFVLGAYLFLVPCGKKS